MTDNEYLIAAEQLLKRVEQECDRLSQLDEVDIDNQRVGQMITLTFQDRSQIIINLQKPLHEVWLAARSGGYHYKLKMGHWIDTKNGRDFFEQLSADAGHQSGHPMLLTA